MRSLPPSASIIVGGRCTRSKTKDAFDRPASNGKAANTIGAAPRNPTHPMKSFSRRDIFMGRKAMRILTGRAMKMATPVMRRPVTKTAGRREGKTSNPKIKNIAICMSQAILKAS